jgi:hypothetical protein
MLTDASIFDYIAKIFLISPPLAIVRVSPPAAVNALAALSFLGCAMRTVPMMRVEIAGAVVTRPGELDVLQYDSTGKPTISRMRPQLLDGEVLIERANAIPAIVRRPHA